MLDSRSDGCIVEVCCSVAALVAVTRSRPGIPVWFGGGFDAPFVRLERQNDESHLTW